MKTILLPASIIILFFACQSGVSETRDNADLEKLIAYMEGSYSSEKQALSDTNYLHITLDMKQIWQEDGNEAWLYVEQTAAWTPEKPYRQRIYRLKQITDSTFTSTIYAIPNPENYIGAHLQPEKLNALSADSIELLTGCTLFLTYRNGTFSGATKEGACLNSWGDASYATSEVTLFADSLYSWDRGWSDQKEQVWGAENGGYLFIKRSEQTR